MAEVVNNSVAEVQTAAEQIPPEKPVAATKQETVVKVAEADTKQAAPTEKTAGKAIDIFDGAADTRQKWEKPIAEIEAAQKAEKQKGRKPAKATKEKVDKQKPDKAAKAPVTKKEPAPKTPTAPKPPKGPEKPAEPVAAPRSGEVEQIVHLKITELHAFKNHPFEVRDDEEMRAMVASVKDKGVSQPAIVRPREGGGYEIVSGHRRQKASELAGFVDIPCIIRKLTDEQAITQMVEDNTNQRENILPSERAKALKMQLEAIKHQGARETSGQIDPKEIGLRSNEIVALRNKMTVKQVQRYISLTKLVKPLQDMVDGKLADANGKALKLSFTPAVEFSFISRKNQNYIAVAIEGQQSAPSLAQAQRLRELDKKGALNDDVIDGIMCEEKKEADKVIISGAELNNYFGKDKTPQEMKAQIIKLLDDWKGKEIAPTQKKADKEK